MGKKRCSSGVHIRSVCDHSYAHFYAPPEIFHSDMHMKTAGKTIEYDTCDTVTRTHIQQLDITSDCVYPWPLVSFPPHPHTGTALHLHVAVSACVCNSVTDSMPLVSVRSLGSLSPVTRHDLSVLISAIEETVQQQSETATPTATL